MLSLIGCNPEHHAESLGKLDIKFKLTYGGVPLQLFKKVAYPETGDSLYFTKVSFYVSDMILTSPSHNHLLTEIDYLDVSGAHTTPNSDGYSYVVNDIPTGTYPNLSFNIGVPKNQNSKTPNDFNGNHPLSKVSEYWSAWKSYIFFRPEGKIAAPGSSDPNLNFALHLGSDSALVPINLTKDVVIQENQTTKLNVEVDLKSFFNARNNHDIRTDRQIHSPSQENLVIKLAENLKASIK